MTECYALAIAAAMISGVIGWFGGYFLGLKKALDETGKLINKMERRP